jgi:hypothetical protein
MNATSVAPAPQLTAEQWIERTAKALELMRLTDTIGELLESPPQRRNERLIAWYRARRAVLASELDLPAMGLPTR